MNDKGTRGRSRGFKVILVSLLAGGGDFATGVLLVLFPATALKWMSLPPIDDPVLLQFVGVFVACVGASYLAGLASWVRSGSCMRLRGVWELTILFRLAAGIFGAVEIGRGGLPWAWISVPLTDWTWALLQAFLLRRGYLEEEV